MPSDLKEVIEQLKIERDFLRHGGYDRSIRGHSKPTRFFRDSVTCPNCGKEVKQLPCNECLLWEWVPENYQEEDTPCHFIPLNDRGETIASLEEAKGREEAEKALVGWLDSVIEHLEAELSRQQGRRP
jgi:hypothetical protein